MPLQVAVRRAELLPPDGAKVQVSVSSLIPANGILNFDFCKPKVIFFFIRILSSKYVFRSRQKYLLSSMPKKQSVQCKGIFQTPPKSIIKLLLTSGGLGPGINGR